MTKVYTVTLRDLNEDNDVLMHVASEFDKAVVWAGTHTEDLQEPHTAYIICCEVVDADDDTFVASGAMIAEFTLPEGLKDYRENMAAAGYVT